MFDLNNPWLVAIIGGILASIFGGFVLYYIRRFKEYNKINKKATIQKGISLLFGELLVNLKVGKIQEISKPIKDSAIALPANTTFIDDCITDSKSALGAFFLKYHPDKIQRVPQDIEKQLKQSRYQQGENGTYPLGTTIILPGKYDIPAKVIITASTIRKETSGIRAEPTSICECIRQIFMITSDKKIAKLYMPILGSGHGGLNINDALLFLVLAIKHYSKFYHHVKSIDIIVTEDDVPKLKDTYRLQYIMLLER